MYFVDTDHMLIVTTDRLSAFDVVLPDPIPGKGLVLTAISNFWFEMMRDLVPNHLSDIPLREVLPDGRGIVVKKMRPLPVEAVVRGYLIGSGWNEYRESGRVSGIGLPQGLQQAQQLPVPLYTPSTKAAPGRHDENIDFDQTVSLLGPELAGRVRDMSLLIYNRAAAYALQRGIIIADTKFEFGLDKTGVLHLIDEVLTPDSSRFWPVASYRTGISPPSYDKQYVRDYLETLDWDKTDPGPRLPQSVIRNTAMKYREALEKLTQ